MSLLMWECGLKQFAGGEADHPVGVTPYVGVWIETFAISLFIYCNKVTPYVGVWIETKALLWLLVSLPSLLMWECGLKL